MYVYSFELSRIATYYLVLAGAFVLESGVKGYTRAIRVVSASIVINRQDVITKFRLYLSALLNISTKDRHP